MPVTTIPADQIRRGGCHPVTTAAGARGGRSSGYHNHSTRNRRNNADQLESEQDRLARRSRATQLWPRFDLVTDVMAADLEGCQRNGVQYVGSLSIANAHKRGVYDIFADHGGYRTEDEFINQPPPASKKLGVYWRDLAPHNGAQPIKDVIQNFVDLAVGRIMVFHDSGADKRMLDHSAAVCGLTIPWDKISVRDTQKYRQYWFNNTNSRTGPSLKDVVEEHLPWMKFREGEHNSLEDAVATLHLYLLDQESIDAMYAPFASPTSAEDNSAASDDTSSASTPETPTTENSLPLYTTHHEGIELAVLTEAAQRFQQAAAAQSTATACYATSSRAFGATATGH